MDKAVLSFLLTFFLFQFTIADFPKDLEDYIEPKHKLLIKLRDAVQSIYTPEKLKTCNPSISGCVTDASSLRIPLNIDCQHKDKVVERPTCGECKGVMESFTHSSVDLAGGLGFADDPVINQDVCRSQLIDETFMTIYQDKDYKDIQKISVEFLSGVVRTFPGKYTGCSVDNEAVKALISTGTGPLNLLIMLDVSGSMDFNDGWSKAWEYASALLDTLNSDTYAQVVFFNNDCYVPVETKMLRSTISHAAWLKESLCRAERGGGTKFMKAFEYAFNVLENSFQAKEATACNSAMIIITDGEVKDRKKSLTRYIRNRNTELQQLMGNELSINFISLGNERKQDVSTLKKIACQNNGVLMTSTNDKEFIHQVYHIQSLFTKAREKYLNYITNNQITVPSIVKAPQGDETVSYFPDIVSTLRWGDPYYTPTGRDITASLPVYVSTGKKDENNKLYPIQFVGAVTIALNYDIIIDESGSTTKPSGDITGVDEILKYLKDGDDEKKLCPPFMLSFDDIQTWRSSVNAKCDSSDFLLDTEKENEATQRIEETESQNAFTPMDTLAYPFFMPTYPSALSFTDKEVNQSNEDTLYNPQNLYVNTDVADRYKAEHGDGDGKPVKISIIEKAAQVCCSLSTADQTVCIGDGTDDKATEYEAVISMIQRCNKALPLTLSIAMLTALLLFLTL